MKPVTLSFDNGPTPGTTGPVLDLLDKHGILSAFFVIGEKLRSGPEASALVARAVAAGHWIGNHSDTHSIPLGRCDPPEAACEEINRAQAAIGTLAHPEKLFRPFGGGALGPHLLNRQAADLLVKDGYTCVIWNAVPADWAGKGNANAHWVERAREQIAQNDWPLVVLHDTEGACLGRLDEFLTGLKAENFDIRQEFPPDCLLIERGIAGSAERLSRFIAA